MAKSLMSAVRGGAPEQDTQAMGAGAGSEDAALNKEENLDVEIGYALGETMLNSPQGQQAVDSALNAGGEPGAALGVLLSQLIAKIQEKMDKSPMPLSPRIWLSKGGVVERWMQDFQVPPEVEDGAKQEIIQQLKLIGQQNQNKGNPQQQTDDSGMEPGGEDEPPQMEEPGEGQPTMMMMGGM